MAWKGGPLIVRYCHLIIKDVIKLTEVNETLHCFLGSGVRLEGESFPLLFPCTCAGTDLWKKLYTVLVCLNTSEVLINFNLSISFFFFQWDLVCDSAWKVHIAKFSLLVGLIFGHLITGCIADW